MIKYISVLRAATLFFILSVCVQQSTFCQTKSELQDRKKKIENQIKFTEQLLGRAEKNSEIALAELSAITKQIEARQELIANIGSQIKLSKAEAQRIEERITSVTNKEKKIIEEYSAILRTAYLHKKTESDILYILSSSSLNEAFRRYIYFKQFETRRKEKHSELLEIRDTLSVQKERLEEEVEEQNSLLQDQKKEYIKLEDASIKQRNILEIARSKEKDLKDDLKTQKKEKKRLDRAIEEIIEREIAENNSGNRGLSEAPEMKKLSADFVSNKGNIPWPVSNGYISGRFGKQAHPSIPTLEIESNGIEISTNPNSLATAVFKGDVVGVVSVPGYQKMVILRHGKYYSVYSRLSEVLVQKGETLETGDGLGYVFYNTRTGDSRLHLEIWKGKEKLNPAQWLLNQ